MSFINLSLKSAAPGPTSRFPLFVSLLAYFRDPVLKAFELQKYGAVVTPAAGSGTMHLIYGEDNVKRILQDSSFHRPESGFAELPDRQEIRGFYRAMITLNGPVHKRHRQLMMPAMHRQALQSYDATILDIAQRESAMWREGEVIDLTKALYSITRKVSIRALMGFGEAEMPRLESLSEDFDFLVISLLDPKIFLFPYDVAPLPYHRWLKVIERTYRTLEEMIAFKRAHLQPDDVDMISLFIRSTDEEGNALSNDEIVGELAGLYAAGFDTTATTLNWTILLLAQHPEVARMLSHEAQQRDDLSRYVEEEGTLLNAVIKESMRLVPATPTLLPLIATVDSEVAGYVIPAGSVITIPTITANYNEATFPTPRRFIPERWIERDNGRLKPSPYQHFPFGVGPRRCFGAPFAERQLRLVLATLCRRFSFASQADQRVDRAMKSIAMSPRQSLSYRVGAPTAWTKVPITQGNLLALVDLS